MHSIKSIALVLVSAIGVGMLCVPATVTSARLVWNFTPSIPTGLYTIEDRVWRRGDHVAVEPSDDLQITLQKYGVLKRGRLLMKRVAASGINAEEIERSYRENGADDHTILLELEAWSLASSMSNDEVNFLLRKACRLPV